MRWHHLAFQSISSHYSSCKQQIPRNSCLSAAPYCLFTLNENLQTRSTVSLYASTCNNTGWLRAHVEITQSHYCSSFSIFIWPLGLSCGKWGSVPWSGLKTGLLHWENGVLALNHQGSPALFPSCIPWFHTSIEHNIQFNSLLFLS